MYEEGSGLNLPEHEKPLRSATVLQNPVGRRHSRHRQDHSLRGRASIHRNKNYTRHKNLSIQSSPVVGVLVLEENSQALRCDMVVGMILENTRKLCDPRTFAAFSGFEVIHLGVDSEVVVWQMNFGPETLQ